MGVATCKDIADYFRMTQREVNPHIGELIDRGDIAPVDVEGWQEPAYLSADARLPRQIPGQSV